MSLRTFPRNFPGRSGTKNDKVYLCSPETAAAAGIFGVITDPRKLGELMPWPGVENPEKYLVDDSSIIFPLDDTSGVEIITGPNIVPFPEFEELPDELSTEVIIKVEDNISTDTIMPAGNKVLPFRSNIPAISQFVFEQLDPEFPQAGTREGKRRGRGRRELRPGLVSRTCGAGPTLPGNPREDRQEFRPHP